jgi:hypothetical protein
MGGGEVRGQEQDQEVVVVQRWGGTTVRWRQGVRKERDTMLSFLFGVRLSTTYPHFSLTHSPFSPR